jgi:glyoxylase-like metal-dependent hydrolase (beta-lactamase superfamily II)
MRYFGMCLGTLALFSVLIVSPLEIVNAQQLPADSPPLIRQDAAQQVSEHVWVIFDEGVRFVPNIGIVVGEEATLIVDTGLGHRNGETVLREASKISSKDNLYLVTTHFHPEHAGGSSAFPEGAQFLLSRTQQLDLEELAVSLAERFATFSTINRELLENVEFRRGDVIFDGGYDVDLGGVQVRLLSLGPTHTRGDTAVFVETDGVLFSGDVVMNKTFLSFNQGSSVQAWLDALDELEDLNPTRIVPSHGDMGGQSLIDEQRTIITAIVDRVEMLRAEGRTLDETEELLRAEFQTEYPAWNTPNRVAAAVRAAWAETPE